MTSNDTILHNIITVDKDFTIWDIDLATKEALNFHGPVSHLNDILEHESSKQFQSTIKTKLAEKSEEFDMNLMFVNSGRACRCKIKMIINPGNDKLEMILIEPNLYELYIQDA